MNHLDLMIQLIPAEILNTFLMVFFASFFSFIFGLPLAVLLYQTKGLIYRGLGIFINVGRSLPFAILMIAAIPLTRFLVGTSIGTLASIVPLSLAGIPFMARLLETSFREVDKNLLEAAHVMGASKRQIMIKVIFPECLPSMISAITTSAVNLIGYSAMAGLVGGGGLGKIAIQYGYQRFNLPLMVVTLLVILLFVEATQFVGNHFFRQIMKTRGKL